MQIRRATLDDIDSLAPLFDAYRGFYGQPSDVDAARAFLRERHERDESVALIAFDDARAVGFVQLYPIFSSVRMRRVWLLNDLYVDAGARRSGAGRAKGALDLARIMPI